MAVTLQEHADALPHSLKAFLFAALYITAIGNGSYEPGLASLGGDQFRTQSEKTTFFNWFFVFCNIGQLVSLTFLTYLENGGRWALGFWISGGVVLVSLPIFFLGVPYCRQYRPGSNPLLRIAQVFFCAFRNMSTRVSPNSPKDLFEVDEAKSKLLHSHQLR